MLGSEKPSQGLSFNTSYLLVIKGNLTANPYLNSWFLNTDGLSCNQGQTPDSSGMPYSVWWGLVNSHGSAEVQGEALEGLVSAEFTLLSH